MHNWLFVLLDKAEYTFCEGMGPVPTSVTPVPQVTCLQVLISIELVSLFLENLSVMVSKTFVFLSMANLADTVP